MQNVKRKLVEAAMCSIDSPLPMLDIGGEGRYAEAWNLNPRTCKTRGRDQGKPIPRLILGRAEDIPLPDGSVACVIVERTPLREQALREIRRVVARAGTIVLRHALPSNLDPHKLAYEVLPGRIQQRKTFVSRHWLQETVFYRGENL